MANGNGKPAEPASRVTPPEPAAAPPVTQSGNGMPLPTPDPLQPRPGMTAQQAMNASPARLIALDPLPPLNRPIFEAPRMAATHTMHLHPMMGGPVVEAAVEELRTKLGELREFLKRFPHAVDGELGALVGHLRVALGVARPDPVRDADRKAEDAHITERRRQEDLAAGGTMSSARLAARAREDAGLAEFRRIQDVPLS